MIVVFAKTPVPGSVKTRLIPDMGVEAATRLYLQLFRRTLKMVFSSALMPVRLQLLGEESHPEIRRLSSKYTLTIAPQQGDDLGERMYLAAEAVLAEGSMVILIGTDCPALTGTYLQQAVDALNDGNDVVLGPAEDGGYVLLGLRCNHADLFTGIDWGSSEVLEQTRSRLDRLGWSYRMLPTLWDIDRVEDVRRLKWTNPEFDSFMPG